MGAAVDMEQIWRKILKKTRWRLPQSKTADALAVVIFSSRLFCNHGGP